MVHDLLKMMHDSRLCHLFESFFSIMLLLPRNNLVLFNSPILDIKPVHDCHHSSMSLPPIAFMHFFPFYVFCNLTLNSSQTFHRENSCLFDIPTGFFHDLHFMKGYCRIFYPFLIRMLFFNLFYQMTLPL